LDCNGIEDNPEFGFTQAGISEVRENKFKLKFEIKKPVEVYSSGFFINFNSFYII